MRKNIYYFSYFLFLGAKNIDNCPAGYTVPIFLIVSGALGLILVPLSAVINCCFKYLSHDSRTGAYLHFITSLLYTCAVMFALVWVISGCIWVFRIYHPNYKGDDDSYCDELTYKTAIVVIISTYIICLFSCCCICCFKKEASYEPINSFDP